MLSINNHIHWVKRPSGTTTVGFGQYLMLERGFSGGVKFTDEWRNLKEKLFFNDTFISIASTQPGSAANEAARRSRHQRVLTKASVLPFQGLLKLSEIFSAKGRSIKNILTPYINFKEKEVTSSVSAGNKLFKRYTAIVGFIFIIGSLSPVTADDLYASYAPADSIDSGVDFSSGSLIADNEGYLTKLNPQTDIGDRSTMNDKLVHTVANGETVSTIAASYGIKTQTILWENGLSNANSIRVGQKLFVPPVDGVTYYAKKTDTVDKLAKAFGVPADSIKRQNGLAASTLTLGQSVFIPGAKPIEDEVITVRTTPVRIGTGTRINNVVASSGGAILPGSKDIPIGDKPFIYPTRGKLTQGYRKGHYAVDIADSSQPPIWAAGAGTVIKANTGCATVSYGCGGGYGNYIIIDHGNGLQTLYGHMTYIEVKVGDKVSQGMVIGKMGRTGNVRGKTGIHLHYEVRLNGKKQVPSNYY
jgi:murein DD-endopeptidase MepM/ murein hydrolase activator NlpD